MARKKITINLHKAKSTLSHLIKAAERGVQVIITRKGEPVVELVPLKTRLERTPGTYPELRVGPEFFASLSNQELEDWETKI
jgi:prevent-host-death family protein